MKKTYSLNKIFKTSFMPFEVYDKMNKLNGKYYDSNLASEYTVQKNKQNVLD